MDTNVNKQFCRWELRSTVYQCSYDLINLYRGRQWVKSGGGHVVRCRELRLVSVVGADVTLRADKMATIHDLCLSYTHFQLNFQQTQHISDKFNFFTKAPVTLMLIKNLKTLFVKDATTISDHRVLLLWRRRRDRLLPASSDSSRDSLLQSFILHRRWHKHRSRI